MSSREPTPTMLFCIQRVSTMSSAVVGATDKTLHKIPGASLIRRRAGR
ncbi:MAG TPA: hypothetical protein VF169_09310 [Albitalea sp.]